MNSLSLQDDSGPRGREDSLQVDREGFHCRTNWGETRASAAESVRAGLAVCGRRERSRTQRGTNADSAGGSQIHSAVLGVGDEGGRNVQVAKGGGVAGVSWTLEVITGPSLLHVLHLFQTLPLLGSFFPFVFVDW